MATRRVDFEVTPGAGIAGYWIAVGEEDIPLVNRKGSANLGSGEQLLSWWMKGNAGAAIAIVGKAGNKEVVSVKSSKIRGGSTEGGGRKYFEV